MWFKRRFHVIHLHARTNKYAGFQLLEIMISIAILSLLASFAIVHYNAYFAKEKRLAAEKELSQLALAMENDQLAKNTYANATLTTLGFAPLTPDHAYLLAIQSSSVSTYLLTATPQGRQAQEDTSCGVLSLNSTGQQGATGEAGVQGCW